MSKFTHSCSACGKPMQSDFDRTGAKVYHVACLNKTMVLERARIKAMGLDKAKEHVNKECPHA